MACKHDCTACRDDLYNVQTRSYDVKIQLYGVLIRPSQRMDAFGGVAGRHADLLLHDRCKIADLLDSQRSRRVGVPVLCFKPKEPRMYRLLFGGVALFLA